MQTHRRHSALSRISWAVETYWRPDALSQHPPPWLDAYSSLADSGSWKVAHLAVNVALETLCAPPHNTVPDQYDARYGKHRELAQVSNLTQPNSPCAPQKNVLGAASRASLLAVFPRNNGPLYLLPPPSWLIPPAPTEGHPFRPGSPPMSRILCRPGCHPMSSRSFYHPAWSFCGG